MSDIIFALKAIAIAVIIVFMIFFAMYFTFANDHLVTIYINPIYFNSLFYGSSPEFQMPVWKLALISVFFGAVMMRIIAQIRFYKQQSQIENLTKEVSTLKSKFDKIKTDVSKCVT